MKRYQSYKPSSIEWIGEIPINWNETRLKYIGNLYGGLTGKSGGDFQQEDNPKNKPYIPYTNIFRNTYISKSHVDYVVLEEGENQNKVQKFDLFFLMSSETYQDLGKPSILIDDIEELYLNSFCKGLRVNRKDINPLFLNYQLLGSVHKELISIEGRGFTRINLRQDRLNETPIFVPPLQEQNQIVRFLDEKTELIDKLISSKERKITLFKEQRTSLINQVVTKGLNPNVKMKDSGVEWIGEIPEKWKFIKLSYIISKSDLGGNYESSTENDGVPLMKMGNLGRGKITLNKIEYLGQDENFDITHKLEYGDFLFNTRNSVELVGKVSLWRNELEYSLYNSNILRITFKEEVDNEFMCYLFNSQSVLDVLKLISKGTTSVSGIYYKDLSEIKIPFPSKIEQQEIVGYLDTKTKEIDDLVYLEQKKIDTLKEYRQSLISEVVTGKIKVTTD
jgi:type I restriction enzyme S subunit